MNPLAAARRVAVLLVLCVLAVPSAFATTFIVPSDAELIEKSPAIVTGVVVSAQSVEVKPHYVETFYEIGVDRVLKGPVKAGTRVTIHSPGGLAGGVFTRVESSAHFRIGDEVLLFLTMHRGTWTPTDLTLGKFRFAMTSGGHNVVVRDAEDIVGWDRDGKVHTEKIRLEAEFVQFIRDTVAGRKSDISYEAEAKDVLAPSTETPDKLVIRPNVAPNEPETYATQLYYCEGDSDPGRWTTAKMTSGVQFFKNAAQNASTLGDGGVSIIQNGLAAWNGPCDSAVNYQYGGTSANLKDGGDGVNVIVFNDPNDDVAGTWTGSGTVAICFVGGSNTHTFDGKTFSSLFDTDIVFQNGYPGNDAAINAAMTHEQGHALGFRHSNKSHLDGCVVVNPDPECDGTFVSCPPEPACNPLIEECSTNAIMNSTAIAALNFTLQTWDINAANALYPATCVTVLPPANVVATATSTSTVQVSWTAAVDATSYNVYRSIDGINYDSPVNTSSTTLIDGGRSANTAYLYKVRSVNSGESTDSNIDLATTIIFTDDPLVAQSTAMKAVHMNELATAINAVRTLAGIGAGTYTGGTLSGGGVTTVAAAHINDRRTALDAARLDLGLPAISYGQTVTSGVTIDDSHVIELRNGVK